MTLTLVGAPAVGGLNATAVLASGAGSTVKVVASTPAVIAAVAVAVAVSASLKSMGWPAASTLAKVKFAPMSVLPASRGLRSWPVMVTVTTVPAGIGDSVPKPVRSTAKPVLA